MTNQQLQKALDMHEAGIKWEIVAAYFQIHTQTLRKQLKNEQTNFRDDGIT